MIGRNLLEHPSIGEFEILAPRSSELDLRDFQSVKFYFAKWRPDMVIHAAGKVGGVHANLREPVRFLMDNLDMGRNVVWAARHEGVQRLINLGSSCIYPRNYPEPLREEMLLKGEFEPTNEGYALAKAVTARLCEYITREEERFQFKTLIPCNIFGRYDKFDPTFSHLVPAIIHKVHKAMKSGENTVEIWGDGTARREFMYAGDLADALVCAIKHFDELPAYMNVGLGEDYTINEYYDITAEVMGYRGVFVHDLSKPVGMTRKLVNIERQKAWGWIAPNNLRSGIEKTCNFYFKEISQ